MTFDPPIEELNPATVTTQNGTYKAVKVSDAFTACDGCAFRDVPCSHIPCSPWDRPDTVSVYFVKVDT